MTIYLFVASIYFYYLFCINIHILIGIRIFVLLKSITIVLNIVSEYLTNFHYFLSMINLLTKFIFGSYKWYKLYHVYAAKNCICKKDCYSRNRRKDMFYRCCCMQLKYQKKNTLVMS